MKRGLVVFSVVSFTTLACAATFFIARHAYQPAAVPVASPPPMPAGSVPVVTADELKARLDSGEDLVVAFIGSRSYFEERHIPGAICVPYEEITTTFQPMDREREIVLYSGCCAGATEGVSGNAVRLLQSMGFTHARHLYGHYAAWQAAQYLSDGTNPVRVTETAYQDAQGKQRLDNFVAEVNRRRSELRLAIESERDPARRQELLNSLTELDAQLEIEGLMLKRQMALEAGNQEKVDDIDRMLKERTSRKGAPSSPK
ncbi:MAG: rhodanese-like domain-containing protein [Planctomycetes bacterium]|nr:rhodanese-like domain-containing protein [Planctomycetota bacterium]